MNNSGCLNFDFDALRSLPQGSSRMEKIGNSIKGMYRDILKGRDESTIFDSGWVSNRIVDRCRILLAAFMKNDKSGGIQYLAIGQGLEVWDSTGAPEPDSSTTGLEAPYPKIGVERLNLEYLDAHENVVENPTSRLQITATLEQNEPEAAPPLSSSPLREFGLFGKYFDGKDFQDYMIDCVRHPVIHKDVNTTLVRVIRLYF